MDTELPSLIVFAVLMSFLFAGAIIRAVENFYFLRKQREWRERQEKEAPLKKMRAEVHRKVIKQLRKFKIT